MVSGGHTSGAALVAVIITYTAVATFLTAARLYTRKLLVRNTGVDDVLIVLGVLLSILVSVTMCEQVSYGVGRHYSTLSDNDKVMSLRWFWASVWIYYLALWAVKMSILFQYLRILPEEGPYRKACYTLMALLTAWTAWAFFSAVFACTPINSFWDMTVKGSCLDRLSVWFANAAFNIVSDICTTVLPLPILNTLRIPKKQKYLLMVVFGLGGLTCVISILRLQSLYVISKSTDVSWDNPLAALWSSMEVNVGIICSCIPTLKGLLTRMFPSLAIGESYIGTRSGTFGSSVESRPDPVNFNKLGHKVPEPDVEKASQEITEIYELGNRSTRDLSATKRQGSMLSPPARASLMTPPRVTEMLQNWLGRETGHGRSDTIETADTVDTMQTTETNLSKNDTARSDSARLQAHSDCARLSLEKGGHRTARH